MLSIFTAVLGLASSAMVVMSTVGGLCMTSFFSGWVMLELNMVSFIAVIVFSNWGDSTAVMKYFIIQSLGSALFIGFIFINLGNGNPSAVQAWGVLSLSLKSGMAPLHLWLVNIMALLSWEGLLILSTLQKIVPLYFLVSIGGPSVSGVVVLSLLLGTVGILGQSVMKKFLAYSSIYMGGWMMACKDQFPLALLYLTIYGLGLMVLMSALSCSSMDSVSGIPTGGDSLKRIIFLFASLLSVMGVPPLLGFFAKIYVVMESVSSASALFTSALLASAPLVAYAYMGLLLKSCMEFSKVGSEGGSPEMMSGIFFISILLTMGAWAL